MSRVAQERGLVGNDADGPVAALGAAVGFAALFSAAACCVLPLVLAAAGFGAGGLATVVPYKWPLTIFAATAVASGWLLHLRERHACASGASCTVPPRPQTVAVLCAATGLVLLSALWSAYLEAPLTRLLASG